MNASQFRTPGAIIRAKHKLLYAIKITWPRYSFNNNIGFRKIVPIEQDYHVSHFGQLPH